MHRVIIFVIFRDNKNIDNRWPIDKQNYWKEIH